MDEKPKPIPNSDDPKQSQRFIDAAIELESDETGKLFEQALTNVKERKAKGRSRSSDNDETRKT